MRKLAKLTGLAVEYRRLLMFPCFKRISRLRGNIRNKNVEIFTINSAQLPGNMVAQIKLEQGDGIYFSAKRRRLGVALAQALGRPIVKSGDMILDRKIVFQARDPDFAGKLFEYEEIRDKFDALLSNKFSRGILTIGQCSIFYHEPAGIMTKGRRKRFATAVDLLCDLFDVLYFFRHKAP
ncbi:MAG: hypothetical protein LBD33_01895 [Puniceicoccales bacterium]|jgi:hypothetical protein|nr:hypothetical protein [Puniceicoccales bacterium]